MPKDKKAIAFGRALLFVAALALGSCATPQKGPLTLYPDEKALKEAKAYSMDNGGIVFADKSIRLALRLVKGAGQEAGVVKQGITKAVGDEATIFLLSIENSSKTNVLLNPVQTTLHYDTGSIDRPMGYPDLYERLARGRGEGEDMAIEEELKEVKDEFYDLPMTIAPGDKVERLLLFHPVPPDSKKATLMIRDIYIGRHTVDAEFPLALMEAAGGPSK
jgi:predicted small lipoprotein YifL